MRRDLSAGIMIGITQPEKYLGTFLHMVHEPDNKTFPSKVPPTFLAHGSRFAELPQHAIPFEIP